jgi:hypothetical protein
VSVGETGEDSATGTPRRAVPLLAVDGRAAVVASLYTTVPALVVGVGLHLLFGPTFGFGALA